MRHCFEYITMAAMLAIALSTPVGAAQVTVSSESEWNEAWSSPDPYPVGGVEWDDVETIGEPLTVFLDAMIGNIRNLELLGDEYHLPVLRLERDRPGLGRQHSWRALTGCVNEHG